MATKQIHKAPRSLSYAELLHAGKYRAIYSKKPAPIPHLEFPADLPQDAASHIQYLIQKLPQTRGRQQEETPLAPMINFDRLTGIVAAHSYGDCIGYYYDEHFDAQLETAPLVPARYYFEQLATKRGDRDAHVIDEYIITINTKSAMATLKAAKRINKDSRELELRILDYFANSVHIVARESSIILTRRPNLFTHMNDFTYLMKRIELHATETKEGRPHTYGVTNCLARSYPLVYTQSVNCAKYLPAIRAITCNRASNRSTKAAPEIPLLIFGAGLASSPSESPPPKFAPSNRANPAEYSDVSPILALSHCDELSLALTTIYTRVLTLLTEVSASAASLLDANSILTEIRAYIYQIKSEHIRLIARDLFVAATSEESAASLPRYLIVNYKRRYNALVAGDYYTQNEYYDRGIDVVESFFYSIKAIKFYLHNIRTAFDETAKLITAARLVRYCEFSSTLAAIGAIFGAYYGFNYLATSHPHDLNAELTRFMIYNSPQRAAIKKRTQSRVSVTLQTVPDNDHKSRFVVNYKNLYETFYRMIKPDLD